MEYNSINFFKIFFQIQSIVSNFFVIIIFFPLNPRPFYRITLIFL